MSCERITTTDNKDNDNNISMQINTGSQTEKLGRTLKMELYREFPGTPEVKTQRFHCNPWSGELRSQQAVQRSQKKKKEKRKKKGLH